eukprot:1012087-Alexandrium_andersonii.AAC.1
MTSPGCGLDCVLVAFWLRPRRERAIAFRTAVWPCAPDHTSPRHPGVLAAFGAASRRLRLRSGSH